MRLLSERQARAARRLSRKLRRAWVETGMHVLVEKARTKGRRYRAAVWQREIEAAKRQREEEVERIRAAARRC